MAASGTGRKRGRPAAGRRAIALQVKSTPEWSEWLAGFAALRGESASALAGRALAELARAEGYRPPPPR